MLEITWKSNNSNLLSRNFVHLHFLLNYVRKLSISSLRFFVWVHIFLTKSILITSLPLKLARCKMSTKCNEAVANSKWWNKNIKGFLLDVYGVAYNCGERPSAIDGSVDAINKLRKAGIPFRFCSNTSTKSSSEVVKFLQSFGFDVREDEVFTPIPALKKFLVKHDLRPFLLLDPETDELFSEFDQKNPNCVVLGDAKHRFIYQNLNRAFQILISVPDSILVTLGTGKYYKETEGTMLDCGTFAKALEFASDKKAICIGKPNKDYFLTALESMKLKPEEAAMIGDDIFGDVQGSQGAGLTGIQVRTGKYRPSDEPHPSVTPDGYVDNLLAAVDAYLEGRNCDA